uniref:Uncharacterized protein n=1 Tax=Neobodo designis TaxID=312471 RepID=A0A7S1Q0P4_NEODS|eukprot:CAMPEP_0174852108 /NCGR_PEP_ID=MMETSP1114-20130205/25193_1 /TAXON_ID=312471 /ORGANISM="Neobodo designis, Strain CCAP 1951/1" /LENGTH=140 /DNA_ID=CAMNT_0016086687 /DNA_START=29 /DNA_END=451 /DNA_ORIENTATION=+
MSDEAFNPLFHQDGQVLKPKRKTPSGVSASEKHRGLKGSVSASAAARKEGTGFVPGEGQTAQSDTASPSQQRGTAKTSHSLTQNADSVEKSMRAAQEAACANAAEDAFAHATVDETLLRGSTATTTAVTNAAVADDDFDF